MKNLKTIPGLRSEFPKKMKVHAKTIKILQKMEENQFGRFELDDSFDSYKVLKQLVKVCEICGYTLLGYRSVSGGNNAVHLTDRNQTDEIFGKFYSFVIMD